MNRFFVFSSLIAFTGAATLGVAPAGLVGAPLAGTPYLVRAPAHDSASIEHHRLGGNFAYSTAEAHAYAEVIPQISTLTHPVAETINTHIPAPIATYQAAPIVRTHHVAQPIFQNIPVHAQVPVTGPVRTHQTVHQPIVHETRTHTVQAVAHAAPIAVAHAAPIAAPAYALNAAAYAQHSGAYAQHAGAFAQHAAPAYAYGAGYPYAALPAGVAAIH